MTLIEPGVFRKLIRLSEQKTFSGDTLLTEFGTVPDCVYYTAAGNVDVTKGPFEFSIDPYSFIGEISIIGGIGSTATVQAQMGTQALVCDRELPLSQKNEKFRISVKELFARYMAIELAQAARVR